LTCKVGQNELGFGV